MIARLVILTLVVSLTLPVTALTPPGHTSPSPWSENIAAAKGKKHKTRNRNNNQQPRTTTVSRAVRGPLTQTFLSSAPITIPAGAPGTSQGSANPYPATIEVGGFANGVVTDVDLLLLDVTHAVEEDIDILLSQDDGRRALVMSDVGRIFGVTDLDVTLDDEAATSLPSTRLASGTFRPTDVSSLGQPPDAFAAPAPAPDGSLALSTFDGVDPNGTWQLWVMDDAGGDTGAIAGWALRITAQVDLTTVNEQVPGSKDKKNTRAKKKGKKGKK